MIFVIFIIELTLFALFRSHDETAKEMLGLIFVITNSALVLVCLAARVKSVYMKFFVLGIALRLFLLFANCYDWFPVPHSGADTEAFAEIASTNYEQGNYDLSRTNYTHLLTTLYFVVGDIRMIAQYLNVVFGMGVMLVGLGIFEELGLDEKRKSLGMFLLAIFPHLCIFSAILLREAPIQYFLALSTLCFIRWMKNKGPQYFYLSFLCILGAVWFHAGCIFWATGYLAAMLYFRPAFGKNTFSPATIVGAIVAGALAIIACTFFMDGRVEAMAEGLREGDTVVSGEDAADKAGSAYLTWLDINNPYLLVLFSPLKMFYFLYSPIPFDWRGVMDVVAFVGNSTFYIWMSWVILRNFRKRQGLPKNISLYLGVSILFMTFAFAFGTIASGTALRHRCKFMPEFLAVTLLLSAPAAGLNGGPMRRPIPPPPPRPTPRL